MYVHEGGNCLDLGALLCMIDKVSLAGLIFGVPVEDVELDANCQQINLGSKCQGGSYLRIVGLGPLTLFRSDIGGSALKGLEYFAIRASSEVHETLGHSVSEVFRLCTSMTELPKLDLSLRPLIALLPLLPLLSLPAIIIKVGGEFSRLGRWRDLIGSRFID